MTRLFPPKKNELLSSSPNLLGKDDDDEDPSADVDEEEDDDDDPSADVEEEEEDDDPSADVDEEDESLDEVTVEAIVEKKGRSRFWWSHTADCIVNNGNSKDEAFGSHLVSKGTLECWTWLGHEGLAEFAWHRFGDGG